VAALADPDCHNEQQAANAASATIKRTVDIREYRPFGADTVDRLINLLRRFERWPALLA
jgi:hypothetical protein